MQEFKQEKESQERPKKVDTHQDQISTDEELFESAKINPNKLDKLSIDAIVKTIVKFGEILSGFELYKYETEYAERIILSLVTDDGETITGLFARQSGKSFTSAIVVPSCGIMLPLLAEAFKSGNITDHRLKPIYKFSHGIWIGVYGPDYDRAAIIGNKINNTLSTDRAKLILSDPDIGMSFPSKLSSYTNRLPRGATIKVKSGNKKVSIEGDTYHLLVTDETQEINDYVIKKSMSPFLASTNGTTVHNGSTYPTKCYFYDVIQVNKKKDVDKKKKLRCHFEYDYKMAEKFNTNYKKYIVKEKEKLGEHSEEFKMSYELFWPLAQGMFITEDFLTTHLGRDYSPAPSDLFNDHVISVDLAKVRDYTVITVIEPDWANPIIIDAESNLKRYTKKIKNWYEISNENYDQQFYMIDDFISNFKWSILVLDATGVGAPIFDRFASKYQNTAGKQVIPFIFSSQSKSEGYALLGRELLSERIIYPNSSKAQEMRKQRAFVRQLTSLAKEMRGNYLSVVSVSDDNDDYPDSLMMNVWAIEEASGMGDIEDFNAIGIYKDINKDVEKAMANPDYQKFVKYLELLGVKGVNKSSMRSGIHRNIEEQSILHRR